LLFEQGHREGVYGTGVGEQQRVMLGDGTRMTLNTDTHLSVDLGSSQRTVDMRDGEALFEVAKDPRRPFVVRAAGTSVVAHGTAFSVRLTPQGAAGGPALTVTLLEGHVSVERAAGEAASALAPSAPRQMQPGERLRLTRSPDGAPATQADRPNLESAVAWQHSEAAFDDVSLADAVAEMNRYNRTPIVLLQPQRLGELRVSVLYRTGDSAGFARAVADLHGLSLQERQGRLELAKPQ
jgi:transmembrane sensor